jgi:hypothetical protein
VVRIQKRARDFCHLQKLQTASGAQLANNSMNTGIFFWGQNGQSVKLSIHLHLEPGLRMTGVIPLLYLYAFTERIEKTLSFFLIPQTKSNSNY